MSILGSILLIAASLLVFVWLPWTLISDKLKQGRERPAFDDLSRRIDGSTDLSRDDLIALHDELVRWSNRTHLWPRTVGRYVIYLRGRIGLPIEPPDKASNP